jgi:hypothetical protein
VLTATIDISFLALDHCSARRLVDRVLMGVSVEVTRVVCLRCVGNRTPQDGWNESGWVTYRSRMRRRGSEGDGRFRGALEREGR